jgi:double-strand break repair protein MRE11
VQNDENLNFLDSNLEIKLPVFIIHGNHDDPSAESNISAIHLMQSAHLLNYLGCEREEDQIIVKPVVLQKEETCVYIYGLGNIKEERLNRLLREEKVVFEKPENEKSAVFILVVHQNRFKATGPAAKNCVMDWAFPGFFDLVIWGHEHDCEVEPRKTQNRGYQIYQPGSTVSTSLTEGEARQKHMFLLEIRKLGFKMTPIPIRNTRQILYKNIELSQVSGSATQAISDIFHQMIQNADKSRILQPPLVRLKIEVTGFDDFQGFALNAKFLDFTANKDVVTLWRRTGKAKDLKSSESHGFSGDVLKILQKQLLKDKKDFKILGIQQILDKMSDFVVKKDVKGIEEYFDRKVEIAVNRIIEGVTRYDQDVIRRKVKELDVSFVDPPVKRKPEVGLKKM